MAIRIGSSWNPSNPFVLNLGVEDERFPGNRQKYYDLVGTAVVEYQDALLQWNAMPTAYVEEPYPHLEITFPPELANTNTPIRVVTDKNTFGPIIWTFPG